METFGKQEEQDIGEIKKIIESGMTIEQWKEKQNLKMKKKTDRATDIKSGKELKLAIQEATKIAKQAASICKKERKPYEQALKDAAKEMGIERKEKTPLSEQQFTKKYINLILKGK